MYFIEFFLSADDIASNIKDLRRLYSICAEVVGMRPMRISSISNQIGLMIPIRMTVFVFVLCECQRGNTEKTKNRQLRFHKLFLNYFQFQFHLFCVWMSSHHSAFPACNPISDLPHIKREPVNCIVSFWNLCRKQIVEISVDSICAKSNIRSKLN